MEQKNFKNDSGERTATAVKLITNSHYNGTWLDSLQCMEGYGVYVFPDGSQYRGYFFRGHFHGYGTLYLAEPFGFTFKGTFLEGKLVEVEEMWFDDGLSVKATIAGLKMDFANWKYCTEHDRRFVEEHLEGLPPVGPLSILTAGKPARQMRKNCYEMDKGIYDPTSRMISKRPAPFARTQFVSCPQEADWIVKNCRHGPLTEININPALCRKIMQNNLESEREVQEHVPNCNYDQKKLHKDYFGKLCPKDKTTANDVSESEESYDVPNNFSTSSSFFNSSLDVDVQEILFQADEYERYDFGRNLSEETDLMVGKHVANRLSLS